MSTLSRLYSYSQFSVYLVTFFAKSCISREQQYYNHHRPNRRRPKYFISATVYFIFRAVNLDVPLLPAAEAFFAFVVRAAGVSVFGPASLLPAASSATGTATLLLVNVAFDLVLASSVWFATLPGVTQHGAKLASELRWCLDRYRC